MLKPALRERLLGALVFLCLGLILVPIFFDSGSDLVIDRESQIPTQLIRITPLQMQEPEVPDDLPPTPLEHEVFIPQESEAGAQPMDSRILNEAGEPQAWVLQIGSFGDPGNATEVVARLLQAGYRAYQRETQSAAQEKLYRVLVGPYLDRRIAEQEQLAIQEMGLNRPLLMDFSP